MQQAALLVVAMALSSSETKTDESKFYDREDKERFYNYFLKPPAKRGRPKKKKRRGGRPRKKTGKKEASQTMIDDNVDALTPKQKADLDARLEEALKQTKTNTQKRINWDLPDNAKLRQRIADSWTNKNDLYEDGETFSKFCKRVGIDRNVLTRFLKRDPKKTRKKRGRPSQLRESVMRHLCEGNICLFVRQEF